MPIARGKTIMRFVSLDDYEKLKSDSDREIAEKDKIIDERNKELERLYACSEKLREELSNIDKALVKTTAEILEL
jgi:septal ring factor EnvC (AmiA/AmiB activator)